MTKTLSQRKRRRQSRLASVNRRRNPLNVLPLPPRPTKVLVVGKKRKIGRRSNRRVVTTRMRSMSKCARDYLTVLEDPFCGKTACVPSLLNFPTQKISVFSRGSFVTGSGGYGAIMCNPWGIFLNMTLASTDATPLTCAAVTYTNTSYTGVAQFPLNNSTNTQVNFTVTNSPWGSATSIRNFEVRLVACGLRIRNTTNIMNRGGSALGLELSNHTTLGGLTFSNGLLDPTAQQINISDDRWHSIVHHPDGPSDLEFYAPMLANGIVTTGAQSNPYTRFFNPYLGFGITAPGSGLTQSFDFEVMGVFEAKGTQVNQLTPSESDPIGMAQVQNMTSDPKTRRPFVGERGGLLESIMSWQGGAASMLGTAALGLAHQTGYRQAIRPYTIL